MSKKNADVDYNFFDTPRDDEQVQVHHVPHVIVKNRPHQKGGTKNGHISSSGSDSYTSDSDSLTDSSGSDDETARSKGKTSCSKNKPVVVTKKYSESGSSSAYSYGSSDEDFEDEESSRQKNTKRVSPKKTQKTQAWEINGSSNNNNETRPKSAKFRNRSKDKSDSDSEITDVSPLNSPRSTPSRSQKQGLNNVQYNSSQTQSGDGEIKLQSDKIDLRLLMDAVSEIDKQERLKSNTRRVMFEPPNSKGGQKNHYSFDKSRISDIEKENQRLLQQIMHQIGPKQKRQQPKVQQQVPRVDRLTSSAVNRRKQQSKIEQDNMKFLNRLQKAKASRGLSRKEQLDEYSKATLYGVPIAAVHEQMEQERLDSTYLRSASSLTSTFGMTPGRRSRPTSAKSNASSIRPGSAKSTMSTASRVSRGSRPGSGKSYRPTDGHQAWDGRPAWDDRFSFS
ncbi:cilia- and flagella-associated protein 97-like [Mytilus trossulus]|uniref:cilia- and flagella-associated protein 97-like n=1 Tax=Mytilus trossulus TaxID=6551 RepID=UPI0030055853